MSGSSRGSPRLALFSAANRMHAYNTYLLMEQQPGC
jgi:hypothetical protein